MSNKVVKKFFNLVENSKEFYKDFLLRDPKNIYIPEIYLCLLYTSDAADERSSLDIGGRRHIKKKKKRGSVYDASHTDHRVMTGEQSLYTYTT